MVHGGPQTGERSELARARVHWRCGGPKLTTATSNQRGGLSGPHHGLWWVVQWQGEADGEEEQAAIVAINVGRLGCREAKWSVAQGEMRCRRGLYIWYGWRVEVVGKRRWSASGGGALIRQLQSLKREGEAGWC
jgi:hypothetical protein